MKKCPYLKFLPDEKPYYEKDVNLVDPLADASTKLGQLQQLCEVQFQHIQKTVCDIYSRCVCSHVSPKVNPPKKFFFLAPNPGVWTISLLKVHLTPPPREGD